MTGRSRLARAARLCAVLVAPLLALGAAPAAAQTQTASITSTPANGTHYVAGDAITARVTISAGIISVSGGTFAEARMSLDVGGATRQARPVEAISNPVGQLYVDFTYTVTADDFDTDGVSIPATAISGPTWGAQGGASIDRNNAALPAQADHKVIGSVASISSTTPALLNENNLDTATVAVALTGVTFGTGVAASSFELVTTMTGVTINSVSSVSSGDTSATLTLASTADISAAADLAVRVLAAAHSGGTDLTTGAVNVAPVSTLDAGPGVTAGALSVAVAEGASGFWTVDVDTDPGAACTAGVTISVASDDPAVTVSPATLTFTTSNWTTAQTVTATAVEDGNVVDETVTISHTVTAPCPASGYTTGLAISSVTVTVDDDDTGIFSIDSPRVVEGDSGPTTMTFTVTLSPAASVQATVDYAYAMTGSAISGVDHAAIPSGTLTFAPGVTTRTITATVNGDTDQEPDEGIGVQLRNPGPSGFALAAGSGRLANGIIVDDDRPTLTIDSPRVAEGNSGTTQLVFTVRLEPASTGQVTVDWSDVGDSTAESGSDYTALAGGTLTFAAGETSKTIAVEVLGDGAVEPDETVRMGIFNPVPSGTPFRGADGTLFLTNIVGVGTIANDDGADAELLSEDRLRERLKGVNEAIAPELARAMTAGTLDAVSGRIGQALSSDGAGPAPGGRASAAMAEAFAGVLAGNETALEEGSWSWKEGLAGRRFALPLSGAAGAAGDGAGSDAGSAGRVTVWGAGDYRNLAGEANGVDWDGRLFGAHVGMDARVGAGGRGLAGLALSWSEGRFDYTDTSARVLGGKAEGEYESRMRSVHPYVGWDWPSVVRAWGSLGYGRGEVTFIDDEAGRQVSDSSLRSASVGGSVRVLSGEEPGMLGPVALDLEGEAWTARFDVDGNGKRLSEMEVRTHRLRVAAKGSREFDLAEGAVLTPSVALGMRLDRGDGETGAGVELGGGVDYAAPGRGWSADLSGRALLAHSGESEDWGLGGSVRLAPASGRGLSLRVAPSWGAPESGLARLWEDGAAGSRAGASDGESRTARLDTEMGYALPAYAGVLTPYGGLGLTEGGARGYRLGARYRLGPAFEFGLEGERRESGGPAARAEHGLMLQGRVRW